VAYEVIMPKAGMAMETGTIIQWLKNEGDTVSTGEALLEIETDKVAMEVEAENDGVLLKILKGAGEVVPVTRTIAYIGEKGEQVPDETAGSGGEPAAQPQRDVATPPPPDGERPQPEAERSRGPGGKVPATPYAKTLARERGIDLEQVEASGEHGEVKARDVLAAAGEAGAGGEVKASSLARRIAADRGIDLHTLSGSGPGGRITKEDVEAAAPAAGKGRQPVSGTVERRKLSSMRKTIARNMSESHQTVPPVTLSAEADVTELMAARARLNEELESRLSLNDFVLKAVVAALKSHPQINVSLDGDDLVFKNDINLGMAVALDEGLIVPVIRRAGALSMSELSHEAKQLAERARSRKLTADELSGGTFTVSNLGMYGVLSFNPIINPPESAILGVCAIQDRLVLEDGEVRVRKVMGLSLTVDHRTIDGAQGAIFLAEIRRLLENPMRILL